MKKIIGASLFTIAAAVFLMPGVSFAETQYFWSRNVLEKSVAGVEGKDSITKSNGFICLNNATGSCEATDFVTGQAFINANFIDLKLRIGTTTAATYPNDQIKLVLCSAISAQSGLTYRCSGAAATVATSTGVSFSELPTQYDTSINGEWTRFLFGESFSWSVVSTTPLYLILYSEGSLVAGWDNLILSSRYTEPEEIEGYTATLATFYCCGGWHSYEEPPIRVGRTSITSIQYPVSSLYAAPEFSKYQVSLADGLATTTLKITVRYGHAGSGTYQYDTSVSTYVMSSNIGSTYNILSMNCYPTLFSGCTDYSAGTQGLTPVTWYAKAYVFNDCLGDGSFDCLVDTSAEITFVYYPGSIVFQGSSATTTGKYVTMYSSTTTCPYGIVCTGTNGTQFYIDSQGNVVPLNSTSTIASDRWLQFYQLWEPLRFKFPWGYVTAISDVITTIASSTATSTWWLMSTSTIEWLDRGVLQQGLDMMVNAGRVFNPILYPIRLITGSMASLGTGYVVIKLFIWML